MSCRENATDVIIRCLFRESYADTVLSNIMNAPVAKAALKMSQDISARLVSKIIYSAEILQ